MEVTPARPLLLSNVRPICLGEGKGQSEGKLDILVGADGKIAQVGQALSAPPEARRIDGDGAWISPGWIDLHAHVWRGGTNISIDPSQCGVAHGVATIVDAGSAGEANFAGFREFIIDRATERIRAFLNLGSIGLVACGQVSELADLRSIDLDRTVACVEANRDVIIGIKVRASGTITGTWGIQALKIGKRIASVLKLPVMAHVGEPPPLFDEVLAELSAGDVVTHCFNGKPGGSLVEDEKLFALAERCASEGIRLDIGHGGASFSFRTAELAIQRGLLPFSISTDLHLRSLEGKVWDLATTMAKLLAVGMPLPKVIEAVTLNPATVVGLPTTGRLDVGSPAEFTLFEVNDAELAVIDSMGVAATLPQVIEPRWTVLGTRAFEAGRYTRRRLVRADPSCLYCGAAKACANPTT